MVFIIIVVKNPIKAVARFFPNVRLAMFFGVLCPFRLTWRSLFCLVLQTPYGGPLNIVWMRVGSAYCFYQQPTNCE